jgi:hypothetical protein
MKYSAILVLLGALAITTQAQRPRTVETAKGDAAESTATVTAAPQTFKAKYEGGVVGYTRKQDGMLSFDDENSRLLFRNKEGKEVLFIPYNAISSAYGDTQSRQPTAAKVAGSVPVPYGLNFPAMFIKKKYRYLTLNFDDPDTGVSGLTSFKLSNKELLTSVLSTLADKADLTQRGEGYVRKKSTAQSTSPDP